MNRRELLQAIGLALLAPKIFATTSPASASVKKWVAAHDEIARQLAAGRISGPKWQSEVERLAREVDIKELLAQIDFAKIENTLDLSKPGGTKASVRLPHPDDPSRGLHYGAAIFGLRRKHAITPHAHRHMVSAHMVIKGELHVRNFDRVGDEPGHVIVEPTVDATIRPGDVSTMSTEKNNVHWFTALTPTAYTLDVVVDGLPPTGKSYVIELLDVTNGARLPGGRRRARIIDWKESVRLYGVEA